MCLYIHQGTLIPNKSILHSWQHVQDWDSHCSSTAAVFQQPDRGTQKIGVKKTEKKKKAEPHTLMSL